LTIVPGEAKAKVGRGTMCMVWCDCLIVWPPCPCDTCMLLLCRTRTVKRCRARAARNRTP
jgi:hypothetical protein